MLLGFDGLCLHWVVYIYNRCMTFTPPHCYIYIYNHPDKEALDMQKQKNDELVNQIAQLQAKLAQQTVAPPAAEPVATPATPQNNSDKVDKVEEMFSQAMARMESLEKRLEQQQQAQHVTQAAPAATESKPAPRAPKPDSDSSDKGNEETSEEDDAEEHMVTPDGKCVPWARLQFTFHMPQIKKSQFTFHLSQFTFDINENINLLDPARPIRMGI